MRQSIKWATCTAEEMGESHGALGSLDFRICPLHEACILQSAVEVPRSAVRSSVDLVNLRIRLGWSLQFYPMENNLWHQLNWRGFNQVGPLLWSAATTISLIILYVVRCGPVC